MTLELSPESVAPDGAIVSSNIAAETLIGNGSEWWRSAVIYQIYPRSFADSNDDGIGDLAGITHRLPALAALGIDAIWLSPFFTSPQHDAGYDVSNYCDVDPLFGTLADFDVLLAASHALGIRVIVDLVPNHTSWDHEWFKEALASPEGSVERARYMFRDGRGANGELPPNNWESVFGGPMWERITNPDGTLGQWYLHIFDVSQPDLDWENPWVREQFHDILRFWLDRGADGFRVDVAHGLIKEEGLPDYTPPEDGGSMGGGSVDAADGSADDRPAGPDGFPATPPYWAQDGVHEIYRGWNEVLSEYEEDRVLCAEAWVEPLTKLARWVREDEMHQAFNFAYLDTDWDAAAIKKIVDESIESFATVGAPATWVLSNHDVVRHASRLALGADNLQGAGIGPKSPGLPDAVLGLRRARAASALMLALPGSAYIYQGEELGLPEAIYLPDESRQDPTWFRTKGERYGRDGCRVPIPWEGGVPSYGFGPGAASWLPQPADWDVFARDAQTDAPGSTLSLYTLALTLRRSFALGTGTLSWLPGYGANVVAFHNSGMIMISNLGAVPLALPAGGDVLLSSEPVVARMLPVDATVWLTAP